MWASLGSCGNYFGVRRHSATVDIRLMNGACRDTESKAQSSQGLKLTQIFCAFFVAAKVDGVGT